MRFTVKWASVLARCERVIEYLERQFGGMSVLLILLCQRWFALQPSFVTHRPQTVQPCSINLATENTKLNASSYSDSTQTLKSFPLNLWICYSEGKERNQTTERSEVSRDPWLWGKDDNERENAKGDRYDSQSTCNHTRCQEENIRPEDFSVGVLIFSISLSVSPLFLL